MHPTDFQAAVTNTRDFEAAEFEANHAQAVNLVMNGLPKLDSKLKQFSDFINQKLEKYLANNRAIYQPPQQCNNLGITNHLQNQLHLLLLSNQPWQQEMCICHYYDVQSNKLETNQPSTLTSNIPPATITEDKLLDTIILFELEEPSITLLFSKATLEEKPITAMYTDAKIDGHPIKLILDSGSVGSIITRQFMDQLGH
ncbi:hypothetical protein G9A89_016341 [Geosiphon pyriformis]|nr:hypothetical protein G9A89_016341 [Geosiphon pyriformis]